MINVLKLNKVADSEKKCNLICLHWVGGNANAFRWLGKSLETSGVAVYGVQLPGRVGGQSVLRLTNTEEIVTQLEAQLTKNANEWNFGSLPLVILGHSYGALISYELTKLVNQTAGSSLHVDSLIISAARFPGLVAAYNMDSTSTLHHKTTDTELYDHVLDLGGLPAGVDPSILKAMLPVIRSDYQAFETYQFSNEIEDDNIVNCPIDAFCADGDTFDMTAMEGWQTLTNQSFNLHQIHDANHFYITDARIKPVLEDKVRAILTSVCNK